MKVEVKKNLYRIIHPQHTFLVTSRDKEEKGNVCSVAWASPVSHDPPLIMIALQHRHKTTSNINETGVFAINVPTYELLEQVKIAGTKTGWDFDKVKNLKLKFSKGKTGCPLIEDCIGWIECALRDKFRCGDHTLFAGEAITAKAEEKYWKGHWDNPEILIHYGGDKYGTGKKT